MNHRMKPNDSLDSKNVGDNLNQCIDHSILRPDTSVEEIKILCVEAIENGFYSVCIPPYYVQHAARFLEDSNVKISTVIGFPMGYSTTYAKVEEMKRAFIDGIDEIDAVINICAVKNGDWNYVKNDIDTMASMTRMKDKVIKINFEVDLLNEDEAKRICDICIESGVDYIQTSTGVNGNGNQPDIVKFLRDYLPERIKIKAAGGIHSKAEALSLLKAGADRIGTSSSLSILKD